MRPCEVKGRKATFHKWSHKAWVIDAGLTIGSHPGWETKRLGTEWINLCPTCAKEV